MPANFYPESMRLEQAFEWAKRDEIPEDFQDWGLADKDGRTVAHEAASRGTLTASFDQWSLALPNGRTVAHVVAGYGGLPHDFDQWSLADEKGWTVAHEAAQNGHLFLPPDSPVWDLRDNRGATVEMVSETGRNVVPHLWHEFKMAVGSGYKGGKISADFDGWRKVVQGKQVAFLAAEWDLLPPEFSDWDISDEKGSTVAHAVAARRPMPADFDQWDLADKDGRTVAHVAAENKFLPRQFDQWTLADNKGWTVAHEAAHARVLPVAKYAVTPLWTLTDNSGQSVAHVSVSREVLPESFPAELWSMVDGEGWTVAARAWVCGNLPRELADRADLIGRITPEMESQAAAWVQWKVAAPNRRPGGSNKADTVFHVWISKGRCPSQDTTQVMAKNVEPGSKYVYAGEILARSAQVAKSVARALALQDSYLSKYLPEDVLDKLRLGVPEPPKKESKARPESGGMLRL